MVSSTALGARTSVPRGNEEIKHPCQLLPTPKHARYIATNLEMVAMAALKNADDAAPHLHSAVPAKVSIRVGVNRGEIILRDL